MTIATLGTFAILVTFVLAASTAALAIVGGARASERLIDASIHGIHGVAALATFASALIVYAFVSGDYGIQYVQHTSDSSMPLFYRITAFWGGLDGSLLFWVLLLSVFSSIAIAANAQRHRSMIAWVVATLALIDLFFIGLLVFLKNPFEPFMLDVPAGGRGLNPLLQNAYMIIHPPSLYLGYVSLAVPFAFGVAALISGEVDSAWQASVRRWTLFSWLFLSLGLILGGLWAYEELGWGGYWAWDPVENAGLLPWFTATAFLHSVMIQERRGMMRVWNLVLVVLSFWLSIVGTFLTRSGVVESVHSFGNDPVLAWTFGVFMAVILIGGIGLIIWRLPLLRARNELESLLSREFAFLANNWILLVMALFVLSATIYPTVSESIGTRVVIGPPFFERVMVPLGLALLALMGLGPLLAWRKTSTESLQRQFLWPIISGGIATVLGFIWLWTSPGDALSFIPPLRPSLKGLSATLGHSAVLGMVCFGLCGFVTATITQEFVRGVAAQRKSRSDVGIGEALIRLLTKARRRYGGYVVHLGVVLMFLGWAGNATKIERKVNLYAGQAAELGDYVLRFEGLHLTEDWQREMITAELSVFVDAEVEGTTMTREGRKVSTVYPARWWYFQMPEQPTTEVSRFMTALGDVYASVQHVDASSGWAQLRLFYNPLVNWIWVGAAVLLAGGLLCLGTRRVESESLGGMGG